MDPKAALNTRLFLRIGENRVIGRGDPEIAESYDAA
jgi:hypothetical protein